MPPTVVDEDSNGWRYLEEARPGHTERYRRVVERYAALCAEDETELREDDVDQIVAKLVWLADMVRLIQNLHPRNGDYGPTLTVIDNALAEADAW